jgi:hypothetical protein
VSVLAMAFRILSGTRDLTLELTGELLLADAITFLIVHRILRGLIISRAWQKSFTSFAPLTLFTFTILRVVFVSLDT